MTSILLVTFENFVLDIKLYMTLHKHKRLGLAQVYSLETDKTRQNFTVLSEVDKEVSFSMILFLIEFNLTLPDLPGALVSNNFV